MLRTAHAAGWGGPDPYDALWWRGWPEALVTRKRGRQVLIQAHARAPVNVRRIYRREDPVIAKALAAFGWAATRLQRYDSTGGARELAQDCFSRLSADRSAGQVAWGYPFPVQTRWSFYAASTPNIIVTSFGALALWDGAQSFGEQAWGTRAENAAKWVNDALWLEKEGWFVYHPDSRALIHNANLLGARTAWRILPEEPAVRARVMRAVEQTLSDQRPDGAFPYGRGPGLEWVDSFHTGYVLEALTDLLDLDPSIEPALCRAAEHYLAHFFGSRGEAWLRPDGRLEDGHSAGTALTTLAALSSRGLVPAEHGEAVFGRVSARMLRKGHAVHRRYRLARTTVRYPRWCDAHVALGLASYAAGSPAPSTTAS